MGIKRILVPLPGSAAHGSKINMGLSAAKALGAHVEALFISQPPSFSGGGASGLGYAGNLATVRSINWYAEERDRTTREMHERLAQACGVTGIPLLGGDDGYGTPRATWREVEGSYVEMAVHRAIAFDLIIASSASVTEESLSAIAEQSLLKTRRPVLLAPLRAEAADLTGRAMVAWDESPECWRAVSAAIPFLTISKSVEVVSVDRYPDRRKASQAEVLAYLRCYGIEANAQVVAPELRSVGDTLLAVAEDHDVGLLVMGAYSHSRLREMLLGGATRHILQNATARPVLLAH